MKILGVIPARYASTRFPGKPLVVINGKTMIRRVYEQALLCADLHKVVIATDNEAILNHAGTFGGNVLMTSPDHRSGTERCSEVVELLAGRGETFDVVINIQGDEPYIHPEQISQLTGCMKITNPLLATLIKKIDDTTELSNPNVVKVVISTAGKALYFSRAAIPFQRGKEPEHWVEQTTYYKHIGIYGYRAEILKHIISSPETPAEKAESLEQLRWLEHGFEIQTEITEYESIAVDTPEDILKIQATMR